MTQESSTDKIKTALAVLTAHSESSLAVIDEEIADLEREIDGLRRMRRMLAKTERQPRAKSAAGGGGDQSAAASGGLGHWAEIEQQVFDYVTSEGRATAGDIAEFLGLAPIQVGKAVSASQRLGKQGSFVVLLE